MKCIRRGILFCIYAVAVGCSTHRAGNVEWRTIDEGFHFKIPANWRKVDVRGIDSHVGNYRGPSAYLEFDEVKWLGMTVAKSASISSEFAAKESNPKLLNHGEEIWHVGGRIASFAVGKADRKTYGNREYSNVAQLYVPYEGEPSYLSVLIFFKSEDKLSTVKEILQSFEWPARKDN